MFVLTFGHVGKWLYKKAKVNFKTYDVTDWTLNKCKTHDAQYFKKLRQSANEIWSVNKAYI